MLYIRRLEFACIKLGSYKHSLAISKGRGQKAYLALARFLLAIVPGVRDLAGEETSLVCEPSSCCLMLSE